MPISTAADEVTRSGLIATLLLVLPGALAAQAGPEAPPPSVPVTAAVSFLSKWSEVAEKGRLHVGGWGGLVFRGRFMVGGGGFTMLERVGLPASEASSGFDLRMGYGGLVLEAWRPLGSRGTAGVGLLAGGGHAEVRDRLQGIEVGADNFMVAEPGIHLSYAVVRYAHIGISGGYRLAWGVDDLPRVSAEDLQAPTVTLFLRFGGG